MKNTQVETKIFHKGFGDKPTSCGLEHGERGNITDNWDGVTCEKCRKIKKILTHVEYELDWSKKEYEKENKKLQEDFTYWLSWVGESMFLTAYYMEEMEKIREALEEPMAMTSLQNMKEYYLRQMVEFPAKAGSTNILSNNCELWKRQVESRILRFIKARLGESYL